MSTPVIDGARQTVAAPARRPRRFGLFSVVTPIDGGDAHWMLGGLTADGEECAEPEWADITCGPSSPKSSRSWYSDQEGDPWLTYMYETCLMTGRVSEAAAKLRTRFLAAEESAAEAGLISQVLAGAPEVTTASTSAAGIIAALEADAAAHYGGQITVYVTADALVESPSYFVQVGDHLETLAGNLVSVGNYEAGTVYASGAVALYRSDLVINGPMPGIGGPGGGQALTNDYYVLAERAYAAIVDCWTAQAGGAP